MMRKNYGSMGKLPLSIKLRQNATTPLRTDRIRSPSNIKIPNINAQRIFRILYPFYKRGFAKDAFPLNYKFTKIC